MAQYPFLAFYYSQTLVRLTVTIQSHPLNLQVQLQAINNQIKHRQHLKNFIISPFLDFNLYPYLHTSCQSHNIWLTDFYLVDTFVDAFREIQWDFFDDYLFAQFLADLSPNQPEFEQG